MTLRKSVTLKTHGDIAYARQVAGELMVEIEASAIKRTKFVTAVSEIARNAINYGQGGVITFHLAEASGRKRALAVCTDRGPGIEDVDAALRDGFSTGKSLGLGLGGAKRLVDQFEIVSTPGSGTRVSLECGPR
ncbi:ATP-binding protein [Hoeflea sp. WL0058]|uniref:ATP-binding protein n=1 Tax=Flavimaribacter sediminis TaxID=2865987 RepID=A0AAE2ZPT5_9HYPH|nr:ATP-binding protein [Flavimaribacter sediminis]MBW8638625.1 ATP-binding protein [Flavimaribacter sediminis]